MTLRKKLDTNIWDATSTYNNWIIEMWESGYRTQLVLIIFSCAVF